MLKQIKLLTKLQLVNLFGINEVRYSKDTKKKGSFLLLGVAWLLIIGMAAVYTCSLSVSFIKLGISDIIPAYLAVFASVIMLFFTFLKAGSVIFQMSTYEMLVSLPVSPAAIVIARFMGMYVTNLILSIVVTVPGICVYGYYINPAISFYVYSIAGILFIPFIPLTVATAAGAAITAVSSRMKHKSIVSAVLSILLVVVLMAGSMQLTGSGELTEEMLNSMAGIISAQLGNIYPPAVWYGNAATEGHIGFFMLFAGISAGIFVIMVWVLKGCFMKVCTALNAAAARNDYRHGSLEVRPVIKAMLIREIKRYFASGIYVTNTIISYIIMVAVSAALLIMGPSETEAMLMLPSGMVLKFLPIVLAMTACISSITSVSVSMEGKEWWLLQTLPLRSRDIWNGKILANIVIALPFYLVSVILSVYAVRPSFAQGIWLVVFPAVYIVYTAVTGITINLAMPVFNWENETRVVKQSASSFTAMIVNFVSVLAIAGSMFLFKELTETVLYSVATAVLGMITVLLYMRNNKKQVSGIG